MFQWQSARRPDSAANRKIHTPTKKAILGVKCQSKAVKLVVYSFICSPAFFAERAAANKHFYISNTSEEHTKGRQMKN